MLAGAAARDGAVGSVQLHRNAFVALQRPAAPAGIALLELRNEGAANALSASMMLDFHARVRELEAAGGAATDAAPGGEAAALRGVVLSGALGGAAFSAGADLRGRALRDAAAGAAMRAVMTDACARLAACGLVSVAALGGPAVGGGAELATAADFRVMTAESSLAFVHARRGVVPGWGGARRLLALLPRPQALWVLATAAPVSPSLAARLGLCDLALEASAGDGAAAAAAAATDFLRELLWRDDAAGEASGAALRAAKRVVGALAAGGDADADGVDVEAAEFDRLWGGGEQRAAMARWEAARAQRRGEQPATD